MTPNSSRVSSAPDGIASDEALAKAPTLRLALLEDNKEAELFNGGGDTAEERLAMRGILVGVSFVREVERAT